MITDVHLIITLIKNKVEKDVKVANLLAFVGGKAAVLDLFGVIF